MVNLWFYRVRNQALGYTRVMNASLTHSVQARPPLFGTVPDRDYLGFWPGGRFDAQRTVRFLGLTKADVARIAGVSVASVRFDQKAPKSVLDRLTEIATVCGLVAQFFVGDATKTALWLRTPNPLLGDVSPRDMIRQSRFGRLRSFVLDALTIGSAPPALVPEEMMEESASMKRGIRAGREHPLIAAHRAEIAALCRRFGVRQLALFGSILRPDFDPQRSDVDIVVEFSHREDASPARQYFDFKAALEELLGRPVDLVELSAMPNTRLRRAIERTQQPLYAEAA